MAMVFSYDAGTNTGKDVPGGSIHRIIGTWETTSGGVATEATQKVSGKLIKAITNPGATAPTDNYDITIKDDQAFDVLTNCEDNLVDRDTTNTEEVYFLVNDDGSLGTGGSPVVNSVLTIAVANGGDTKQGVIHLYYQT